MEQTAHHQDLRAPCAADPPELYPNPNPVPNPNPNPNQVRRRPTRAHACARQRGGAHPWLD